METVKKQTKPWPLLILFAVSFVALCYGLFALPPGSFFLLFGIHISYLFIFFSLLFLCIYGLVAFILRSALQGILVGLCICCFLIFRLANLINPFFTILLFILFLCIEAIVWKRK